MSHRVQAILIGAATVAVGVTSVSALRWTAANRAASSASARTDTVIRDARQIIQLRSAAETVALAEPPQQDVLRRVRAALAQTGLGDDRLSSLASKGDAAVRGSDRERERSYTLVLDRLSPSLLGMFVGYWSEHQPLWSVTSIDLVADARRAQQTDTAFPFRVTLVLTARYLADRGGEGSGS